MKKAKASLKKATRKVVKVTKAAKSSRREEASYETEGTLLTQKQRQAIKARCVEALDLNTLAQIEDRDAACDELVQLE